MHMREFIPTGLPRGKFDTTNVYKEDLVEYRWRITWLNHAAVIDTIQTRRAEKDAAAAEAEAKRNEVQRVKDSKTATDPMIEAGRKFVEDAKHSKEKAATHARSAMDAHIAAKKSKSEGVEVARVAREAADSHAENAKARCEETKEKLILAVESAKIGNVPGTEEAIEELMDLAGDVADIACRAEKEADKAKTAASRSRAIRKI
jgi:hypothetical protein